MAQPKVNTVILSSIPLNKKLKAYYISKYTWLAEHNGLKYAASVFKEMREIALAYRADTHRLENREQYLQRMPVRKNGWLRMLFEYLDCHPEYVLNFLKLYVGLEEPVVSVEESANTQDSYLKSRDRSVNTDVPSFLTNWLDLITGKVRVFPSEYRLICSHWSEDERIVAILGDDSKVHTISRKRFDELGFLSNYAKGHSYAEFQSYIRKWRQYLRIPKISDDQLVEAAKAAEPLPEMYVDFDRRSEQSESLERDLWNLYNMEIVAETGGWVETPTLSPTALSFVESFLSPNLMVLWDSWDFGEGLPAIEKSFLDGCYVGNIHHIPKKGTVRRRPIAAPNRFLQMGMHPAYQILKKMVSHLPKDATFNQDRFDQKITNRVTNENLYVGSVDLSQATDNLPFLWGEKIWNELVRTKVSPLVNQSWDLFVECSRGRWNNDGILSHWTVGQPLGCLPSFMVLSMTHNLFLESLSFQCGYGHSPYCILGDDVVIMTKKLRKQYISQLTKRGIPLSLHKSYEGNLTEFAGKTYIKNHIPFYTSDQSALGFGNLYDYQRATGICIPWDHLPCKLKRRFERESRQWGIQDRSIFPLVYALGQLANCGKSCYHFDTTDEDSLLTSYFFHDAVLTEDRRPDPNMQSGIVMISGHPITYLDYGYTEKHGYKQRFREIGLPEWYKRKFRPVSTDKIVHCATLAVKEIKVSQIVTG